MDALKAGPSNRRHHNTSWATQSYDNRDMLPKDFIQDNTKLSSGDDRMCARCTNVKIEEEIIAPCPPMTRFIASLGEINDEMRHASCPLCRLFAAVYNPASVRRRTPNATYHLRAFESSHTAGPAIWPKHSTNAAGVILGVCRGSRETLRVSERRRCLTKGFIAPLASQSFADGSEAQIKFRAQEVRSKVTSFIQVKRWLDICHNTHGEACKKTTSDRPAKLKCLDANNCMRMVPKVIGIGDEYLALSYVCSEACERRSCQEGNDGAQPQSIQHVCQTIEDALAVTRSLGFQYLWVDKYCINQHNDLEKRAAIATMDQIYEGASMTLVAAPLLESRSGLPGISRGRCSPQPTVKIGRYSWTSTLPHLSVAVASSTWVTRGWTYQEMVLSTRCLFFTDVQIYFLCQRGIASESTTSPSDIELPSLGICKFRSYALNTDLANPRQRPEGLWQFFEDLYHYKCRDLSFDIDSLNAFQGILKRYDFKHVWGIPIVYQSQESVAAKGREMKKGFLRGLWWENPGHRSCNSLPPDHRHASFCRRPQFPSWSWPGWKGPISPHNLRGNISSDDVCNAISEHSSEIYLWFETADGSLKSLEQTIEDAELKMSHVMRIGTTTYKVRIRRPTGTNRFPHICGCCMERPQCNVRHTVEQNVRLFHDPYLLDSPEEILERYWYVIHLFDVDDSSAESHPLMAAFVADWDGNCEHLAQVIGVAYLDLHSLPAGVRKIVRLS